MPRKKQPIFLFTTFFIALLTTLFSRLMLEDAFGHSTEEKLERQGYKSKTQPSQSPQSSNSETPSKEIEIPEGNLPEGNLPTSTITESLGRWTQENFQEGRPLYLLVTTGITGGCWLLVNRFRKTIKQQKKDLEKLKSESIDREMEAVDKTRKTVLESLSIPEKLDENEKRNSIIIVGLGGTGKTTLINRLFEEDKADSRIATRYYQVYSSSNEDSSYKYNYYVADYMGQNIGTLIGGLMQEQKHPYSPMTLGAINSIIFVVDLSEAMPPAARSQWEGEAWEKRAEYHRKEWSQTALDSIFGLVTSSSLRYVCLFINKVDLFPGLDDKIVVDKYRELINKIANISRGWEFEYLIGSAQKGTCVPQLKSSLKRCSVSSS